MDAVIGQTISHYLIHEKLSRSVLFRDRAICVGWLAMLMVIAGCGGESPTNLNNVVVTVAPANASVATGGEVSLTATVTGVPGGQPALVWAITEAQVNGATGFECNWRGSSPPSGSCPAGTLQGTDVPSPMTVTYHAPDTPGTFHVTVQWSTVFTPVIIKSATSTITVTP